MVPMLTCLTFYLLVFALCHWRPNAGRIFVGIFFLLMAWGVNFVICLINPKLFVELGRHSYIPFYQTIFTEVIALAPLFWGALVVVFETAAGLLILRGGAYTRLGLILGIIFLLGILPFSLGTLPNAVLALALQYLLTKDAGTLRVAHA